VSVAVGCSNRGSLLQLVQVSPEGPVLVVEVAGLEDHPGELLLSHVVAPSASSIEVTGAGRPLIVNSNVLGAEVCSEVTPEFEVHVAALESFM